MKKIQDAGGKVEDKMTIPGVGYMSFFHDTEGNVFGLMQDDEKAEGDSEQDCCGMSRQ